MGPHSTIVARGFPHKPITRYSRPIAGYRELQAGECLNTRLQGKGCPSQVPIALGKPIGHLERGCPSQVPIVLGKPIGHLKPHHRRKREWRVGASLWDDVELILLGCRL